MGFVSPGDKLRELRQRLNINQKQLEIAGVSRNFISMYECNKRNLNKDTANKIIKVLKEVAVSKGINIDNDVEYLFINPECAALNYCKNKIDNFESDLSMYEIDEIISISQTYNFSDMLYKGLIAKGNLLYVNRDYSNSFFNYQDALTIVIRDGDISELSKVYNKLGKCKLSLLNYEEALICFEKAYQYSIMCDDFICKKNSLFNLSLAYKNLNRFDEAIDRISRYIELIDINKSEEEYINAVILKANCYVAKTEYKEAIKLYEDIEEMDLTKSDGVLGYIYNNLGCIYLNLENKNKSLQYFNKAQEIREQSYEPKLSRTLLDKSELYIKSNSYEKAINLIITGIKIAEKYKDNACIIKGYTLLEKIYSEKNDFNNLENTYMKLLNSYELIEDKTQTIKVLNKLSLLNINIGNIENAKSFIEYAIKLQM